MMMPITTSQRGIAYLLLISQLLTSCGWNETIIQPKQAATVQQEKIRKAGNVVDLPTELVEESTIVSFSLEKDENERSLPSTSSLPSDRKELKASSLRLQAQGGHEVTIMEDDAQAIIAEKVHPPFERQPLTLPLVRFPQVSLQQLAQQDKKAQERVVRVVFPEQVKPSKQQGAYSIDQLYPKGYVLIAHQGLKGGAPGMQLDVEKLISAIVSGYSLVGKKPSTTEINTWRPFFKELASALASVEIDFSPLHGPVSISHLDPGNVKSSFEAIASKATGRNVQLENYGKAYIHMMNQVREQIAKKQSIKIDPAKYPTSSYQINLKPSEDLFSMIALSQEVGKVYIQSTSSSVTFDLANCLGVVAVEVIFNTSFNDFERKEEEKGKRSPWEKQESQQETSTDQEEKSKSSATFSFVEENIKWVKDESKRKELEEKLKSMKEKGEERLKRMKEKEAEYKQKQATVQEQRRALELRLHTSNTISNPAFKSSLNSAMLGIFDSIAKCISEPPTSISKADTINSFHIGSSLKVPGSMTLKGSNITFPGPSIVLSKESKKEQNTLTTTASKEEVKQHKEEEEEITTISEAGLNFIAKHEGCILKEKPDEVGYPTIGYGHLITKGEVFNKELSREEAWELLKKDAEDRAAKYVRHYVKVKLLQNQFDALVSFTFNLGCGTLASSEKKDLLKYVNDEEYNKGEAGREKIRQSFMKYDGAKNKDTGEKVILRGLKLRREREAKLFLEGIYEW